VLRRLATHGISVLLAMTVLFASNFECLARTVSSTGTGGCCQHGPCKKSPGTASHSTCQTVPASPERATVPVIASHHSAALVTDRPVDELVAVAKEKAQVTPQYAPPDLFVLNSSFLI